MYTKRKYYYVHHFLMLYRDCMVQWAKPWILKELTFKNLFHNSFCKSNFIWKMKSESICIVDGMVNLSKPIQNVILNRKWELKSQIPTGESTLKRLFYVLRLKMEIQYKNLKRTKIMLLVTAFSGMFHNFKYIWLNLKKILFNLIRL